MLQVQSLLLHLQIGERDKWLCENHYFPTFHRFAKIQPFIVTPSVECQFRSILANGHSQGGQLIASCERPDCFYGKQIERSKSAWRKKEIPEIRESCTTRPLINLSSGGNNFTFQSHIPLLADHQQHRSNCPTHNSLRLLQPLRFAPDGGHCTQD